MWGLVAEGRYLKITLHLVCFFSLKNSLIYLAFTSYQGFTLQRFCTDLKHSIFPCSYLLHDIWKIPSRWLVFFVMTLLDCYVTTNFLNQSFFFTNCLIINCRRKKLEVINYLCYLAIIYYRVVFCRISFMTWYSSFRKMSTNMQMFLWILLISYYSAVEMWMIGEWERICVLFVCFVCLNESLDQ